MPHCTGLPDAVLCFLDRRSVQERQNLEARDVGLAPRLRDAMDEKRNTDAHVLLEGGGSERDNGEYDAFCVAFACCPARSLPYTTLFVTSWRGKHSAKVGKSAAREHRAEFAPLRAALLELQNYEGRGKQFA